MMGLRNSIIASRSSSGPPHSHFLWDSSDCKFINGIPIPKSSEQEGSAPLSEEDARQRTITSIVRRQGQTEFRNNLIRAYEGQCAITRCTAIEALEAAHIEPYMGKKTNVVTNGLLLRADIHTLFDLGYISIDAQSLSVIVDAKLKGTEYAELSGKRIFTPRNKADRPNRRALENHNRWAAGSYADLKPEVPK